ncbi:Putative Thiol methyltransferase [[Torrubiella] hemipterigena]|uniref:Putative Thiol methyltransferase n=1 Tax=[Torrubiella] hemipterigena TaxID=1531966 RepID=A0A0A1TSZ8_9HYPO|nr:Putative Thiol methyltransferase [[Torrubiella] hemipterigena]
MNAPISSPSTKGSSAMSGPKSAATPMTMPQPAQTKQPSTDLFLKDFTLVAEAAKRAQVAVMVRDFENCGL